MQQVEFERFEDPVDLLRYLNDQSINTCEELGRKDRIYAALVRATQLRGDGGKLASTLLWLGLWPALDAIYNRLLRRYYYHDPEALVSEIGAKFTDAIHRANLDRINRVAATLTRNVQRDIMKGLKRQWAEEKLLPIEASALCVYVRRASKCGLPFFFDAEEETQALRDVLSKMISETDADLAIWSAVMGESHRELAARMGTTYATASQRKQRAFRRLRSALKKSEESLSHPGL